MKTYDLNQINLLIKLIPKLKGVVSKINSNEDVSVEKLESILMQTSIFEGESIIIKKDMTIDDYSRIIRKYINKKNKKI